MIVLLLALAQTAAATTAPASDQPKRRLDVRLDMSRDFFVERDLNKDGQISLAEYQAAMEARLDEAISRSPEAQAGFKPEHRARFLETAAASFRLIDVDSNGQLAEAELFKKLPQNP